VAYAGGWRKLEPMWDIVIRAKRATSMLPVLEEVLSGFGQYRPLAESKESTMETKLPTPIRIALPTVEDPPPPAPPPCAGEGSKLPLPLGRGDVGPHGRHDEGWGEGLSSTPRPDDGAPRFIPLAVAIDLGMTPPIGSIRTTEVEITPADEAQPSRPARRHLRLLPTSGA